MFSLIPLDGKRPVEKDWPKWCERPRRFNPKDFEGRNAGIPCGPANGILVLDVDEPSLFYQRAKERGWQRPVTRVHLTGTGKPHFLFQYPKNGKRYGCRSFKNLGFDIRGIGGQVVAPGSVHPDTGELYRVHNEGEIAPAPDWLLKLALQDEENSKHGTGSASNRPRWSGNLDTLPIPLPVKKLIREGESRGNRSEAIFSVLQTLLRAGVDEQTVRSIFERYPIGEKYREKGQGREKWLRSEIKRAVKKIGTRNKGEPEVAARVREYLLEEFDGGIFRLADLTRELGLTEKQRVLARQTVRRMVGQGLLEKHGHSLGVYRVIDRRKTKINWEEAEAARSSLVLPGSLHEIAIIRAGDMVCFTGYKNGAKTALAIETVKLNLNHFKVHFFITEYRARMKQRLLDFGIDLSHPNLNCYQIEKSDYIPDKIEPGEGVLNVIDHYPNLDNFYLIGKHQDEIHRGLNGAICVVTHQKGKPDDLDAVGGSFWTITPTLAVTIFYDEDMEYPGRLMVRKGKEPGDEHELITGLGRRFKLIRGSRFIFDKEGWRRISIK
ncbi:MAG: bifunctional DNA primase/polymerase [Deltaproteobacteria bacterium]|nr:bifunctional DNA primase/polymerase [Deltaproteobacteria bacterium]